MYMTKLVDPLKRISEFGLYLAVATYFFSSALLLIGVYTALVAWLSSRFLNHERLLPKTGLDRILVLLIATLVLSIAFGENWYEGMRGLHKWFRGILLFFLATNLFSDQRIERNVLKLILISFAVMTINGFIQYFTGQDLIRGFEVGSVNGLIRITSSFGYFGMYAAFLLVITPILTTWLLQTSNKTRRAFYVFSILTISVVSLYLTRSRGAWLAFFVTILLMVITQRRWWALICLLITLVATPFLLPQRLVFHAKKSVGFDKTIGHRFYLWNQAIRIIRARPLTGCGLNTYVQNIERYNPPDDHEVRNYYAHNGYLQHAAETGIPGIILLLVLFFQFFRLTFSNWWIHRLNLFEVKSGIILSVSGFLFYMLFDTIFHNLEPFIFLWLLMGWGIAKSHQHLTERVNV